MVLYLKVTNDRYRLPVAVAESASELSRLTGKKKTSILSVISHARKDGKESLYIRVEVDD